MNKSTLANHEIPLEAIEPERVYVLLVIAPVYTSVSNNTPTKTSLLWGFTLKFHLSFLNDMIDIEIKKRGGNMAQIRAPAKKESPNN